MFNNTRKGCGARRRPGVASNCTVGGTDSGGARRHGSNTIATGRAALS